MERGKELILTPHTGPSTEILAPKKQLTSGPPCHVCKKALGVIIIFVLPSLTRRLYPPYVSIDTHAIISKGKQPHCFQTKSLASQPRTAIQIYTIMVSFKNIKENTQSPQTLTNQKLNLANLLSFPLPFIFHVSED